MSDNVLFYQAGGFWGDDSPIGDIRIDYMVPDYVCSHCGQSGVRTHFVYPHLNPREVLSEGDLKVVRNMKTRRVTNDDVERVCGILGDTWGVPVTSGTMFGPTALKLTQKPKDDVHVLVCQLGFLIRKGALEKLLARGVDLKCVQSPSYGKWASEGNFFEVYVPVLGHDWMPEGTTFCQQCYRTSPAIENAKIVRDSSLLKFPTFKTFERGRIMFNHWFIQTISELGITGFEPKDRLYPEVGHKAVL